MIESGSLSPGVDPANFGLAPNTALRYELPDPALAELVSDYHVMDSEGPEVMQASQWALPTWSFIRFVLAENPISVEIGPARFDPLPEAAFFGTTSRVAKWTTSGGVTIGLSITPLGVARMFDIDAAKFRDQIVPLSELVSHRVYADLLRDLRHSNQGTDVKPILDKFLIPRMVKPHRLEREIASLSALLVDDSVTGAGDVAKRLGLPIHRLRRLSLRYFGFPPTILLRRSRFLRSLLALMVSDAANQASAIEESYTDASHFLRDSQRFLGMTGRQFLALEKPYFGALLRARQQVLGAASYALAPVTTRQ